MERKELSARAKSILRVFWILFGSAILLGILIIALIINGVIGYMPPIEELENPKDKYASVVYSSDHQILGSYHLGKSNRIFVKYDDIAPCVTDALVATEDVRFESHSGVDAISLGRAIIKGGLFRQDNAGGGSTITQQLAKMLYSPTAESKFQRMLQKPIEWCIAVQLERYYTKDEIINMYLNKVDFLNLGVGIKMASNVYFGITPDKLTIEQAAMLVGMCKNPSYFNPLRRPELVIGRRNVVLDQMYKYDKISKSQRDSLQKLDLGLNVHKADHKEGLAAYYREYLRLIMTASKPDRSKYRGWQMEQYSRDSLSWQNNPLYGWCKKNYKANGDTYNLGIDGLKIYTTIDSRMQRYAEESVREHLGGFLQPKFFQEKSKKPYAPFSNKTSQEQRDAILNKAMRTSDRYRVLKSAGWSEEKIKKSFFTKTEMTVFSYRGFIDTIMTPMDSIKYHKTFLRSAFMAMDSRTGAVKAYVGGIDFRQFQYDMVTQGRRQVGSTIKPFLYTLAMESGFTPCDEMRHVSQRHLDENGNIWEPRNVGAKRVGEMVSLQWGLAASSNWTSAYLISKLSPAAFVNLLHSFGVTGTLPAVISMALGPCEISLEEMISAYSAFPNLGQRALPMMVSRIEDDLGNVISEFTPQYSEVFSEDAGAKMLTMLQSVTNGGTASRLRYRYQLTAPMGGKTGTTNSNSDGWFIGFTPSLVAGAWVGGEERDIHFDYTSDGQGATMALPIYAEFMKRVYADQSLGYTQTEAFPSLLKYNICGQEKVSSISVDYTKGIDSMFD